MTAGRDPRPPRCAPPAPLRPLVLTAAAAALVAALLAVPWPYQPFDQPHALGNDYGEYQDYGTGGYYHDGVDLVTPAGPARAHAVESGVVTHLTVNQPIYSGVMIGEARAGAEGWLYWHIDAATLQFDIGDSVEAGDYIGTTASWPVHDFHHLHLSRVRGTGGAVPWSWYAAIENPIRLLGPRDDSDPPAFEVVCQGRTIAFTRDGAATILDPNALSGDVDVVCRIADVVGMPQWRLAPWKVEYWIDGAVRDVPLTNAVTFSGECPATSTVSTVYRNLYPLVSRGSYDERIFYYNVTNTDGDGAIEAGDAAASWRTGDFGPGDYWVYVRATDLGGNAVVDSARCTVAGSAAQGDIGLASASHDFGAVPAGSTTSAAMRVTNAGPGWLSVRSVVSTDPLSFAPGASHFFIAPAGAVDVTILFTPMGTGERTAMIRVRSNDPDEPEIAFAVRGCTLDPAAIEADGRPAAGGSAAPADARLAIRGGRSRGDGAVDLTFTLDRAAAAAAPARLELFDILGRSVTGAEVGPLGPGAHTWTWNGRDAAGRSAPAGVYLVRLRSGARSARGSIVFLP